MLGNTWAPHGSTWGIRGNKFRDDKTMRNPSNTMGVAAGLCRLFFLLGGIIPAKCMDQEIQSLQDMTACDIATFLKLSSRRTQLHPQANFKCTFQSHINFIQPNFLYTLHLNHMVSVWSDICPLVHLWVISSSKISAASDETLGSLVGVNAL